MEISLQWHKQLLSYDAASTMGIGNFFALTWSIIAGPVTYIESINLNWVTKCFLMGEPLLIVGLNLSMILSLQI